MKRKSSNECCLELINILGDKKRLSIVLFLAGGGKCVCEIFEHLNLPQNLASHHLGVLRRNKIIKSRKDGRWVRYSLDKRKVKELQRFFEKIIATKEKINKCKFNN